MTKATKKNYVYDIESYQHLFCVVFKEVKTGEIIEFEVSKRKNEIKEFITFLKKTNYLIGFNNVNYDYPVIHWILNNYHRYYTYLDLTNAIFNESNRIIFNNEYTAIKNPKYKQIDLYKIHHFDNKARATSLKALEIAMRMNNVKDLPYAINDVLTDSQIQEILEYCEHDVKATYKFYELSKNQIKLRFDIGKEYNIDVINASDAKMGETILLNELAKDMGIPVYELRKMRTYRDELIFEDYILPYIKFKNKEFNDLLNGLKQVRTTTTKDAFKQSVFYKGFQFDYGQGGLHGCIKPGVYTPNEDEIILDLDVKSFYPNVAIVNDFRPEHLGKSFSRVYNGIYIERGNYPKSDSRNYALKIALNGSYGKSNDENSFLYDPAFTMKITLNGQLSLTMIIEEILDSIDCTLLQVNTDGFTLKCKKSDIELINKLVYDWMELTQLELESAEYSKMIIRDVNNYIAVYTNGKTKEKGIFEIKRDWHKNHSMLIVPKALYEYYINDIDYRETVYNCDDIFDFCKRGRSNKDSKIVSRKLEKFNYIDKDLQKNNRYIVSKQGVELIKILPQLESKDKLKSDKFKNQLSLFDFIEDVKVNIDRETNLEAGHKCTVLNEILDPNSNNYDINYNYYIQEVEKITKLIA